MKKKDLKGFVTGLIVATLVFSLCIPAIAKSGKIQKELTYNNISVTLDGQKLDLKDAKGNSVEPFRMDGTNYLPVRALAEALGLNVAWDSATQTVVLTRGQNESGNTQKVEEGFVFSTKQTTKYDPILDWTTTTSEVTNNSGKDYSYVMVSVTYYDKDNTVLGQGNAIISGLVNGQTKTFETMISGDYSEAASLKFQVDTKW